MKKGMFEEGKRSGVGMQIDKETGEKYVGEWKENKRHGYELGSWI